MNVGFESTALAILRPRRGSVARDRLQTNQSMGWRHNFVRKSGQKAAEAAADVSFASVSVNAVRTDSP